MLWYPVGTIPSFPFVATYCLCQPVCLVFIPWESAISSLSWGVEMQPPLTSDLRNIVAHECFRMTEGCCLKILGPLQDLLLLKLVRWDVTVRRCNKSPRDVGVPWGLITTALSILYLECYSSLLSCRPNCSDHSCKSLQANVSLSPLCYRSQVVGIRGTGVQHKCSGCRVIKLVSNLRLAAI